MIKVTKYLTPKVDSTMHGPTQHNGLVYFQINYYLVYWPWMGKTRWCFLNWQNWHSKP